MNIVKYLVDHDAIINIDYGPSPLIEPIKEGHIEIVKYLVEHGTDINKKKIIMMKNTIIFCLFQWK